MRYVRKGKPRPRWTEEELAVLNEFYGKIPQRDLLPLLPRRDVHSIHNQAYRLGLKGDTGLSIRQHHFNEAYFSTPNIRCSYWAGLIAADGCIASKKCLSLHQSDRSVIKAFCDELNYTGPILRREPRESKVVKKSFAVKPNYCVQLYSTRIVDDLERHYSIVKRKSLILMPPNLMDREHALAYITGYIDGDGYVVNRPKPVIGALGTEYVLRWITDVVGIPRTIRTKDNIHEITFNCSFAVSLAKQILSVKELDGIRFSRKWDIVTKVWESRYADQFK